METLKYLEHPLFKIGEQTITLVSVIIFVIVLLTVIIFSRILKRLLVKKIFPRYEISPGNSKSLSRIISYFVVLLGFLVALNTAGINVSMLFAGGAAVMIGIGFGLQNIANNFISGIIILFERPIKEGDFIEFGGRMGTVEKISARSTKVKTLSGITIIIPNSFFIEQEVINRSYVEKSQIDIPVTVSHDADIEKVKSILLKLAVENELVLNEFPASVSFFEITELGILVKLWVWIADADKGGIIRSQINYRIIQEFRKEGISFPVPQRVVREIKK
ncbi:MAG: mechanosensitive ion channel [Ignavibacteria bacterium]|jgi:small-conductance mechanosensitive channel|nr:mechanosensitive ion channel [Ignavibacteria bacterium]